VADSSVAITAGAGTPIDTFQVAGGDQQQIVREARATAESESFWPASTTASTSQVAADASRLGVIVVNNTTGKVYLRFDATAPTSASNGHHFFLEAGDRWEVPFYLSTLAISVIAAIASGHVVFHLATAA
jgi:hypothetical protein